MTRMGRMSVPLGTHGPMRPDILLAFEHAWPRHTGHKEEQIRRELGITPARYYQLLGRAAESREGMATHPITARVVRSRSAHRVQNTVQRRFPQRAGDSEIASDLA